MSEALTVIIQSFAVFSLLLLIGCFLRAKLRLFQNLYLPACVIGGFIGLILGPNVLGIIPFSQNVMDVASALPGVLIVPVLAAVPMCMKSSGISLKSQKDVLVITFIITGVSFLQFVLGLAVNLGYTALGGESYSTLGLELPMGFTGGHGMAGTLGNSLQTMGSPYWEVAQGMASTSATVGLIGGIIIGVALLNMAAKKGYTKVVKSAAEISKEYRVGYFSRNQERPELGVQTTIPNSIETVSLHFALLLVASGGGYIINSQVSKLNIEILTAMSTWFYAMIVMAVLWGCICALKIDFLFEDDVKNKITGFLSDYLIVAAIMSIPVKMVMTYWVPLLCMFVLGLIVTPLTVYFISKKYMSDCWFEKMMGPLGCLHGVYVTGMLLTKMADPDLKTPALKDYSLGYTLSSFVCIPVFAFLIAFTYTSGTMMGLLASVAVTAASFLAMAVLCRRK